MMYLPLHIEKATNMPEFFWHPSVVYIEEGLGGHKWWMAQTPFPPCTIEPYRDRYEIPCIHYSDDGITWKSIPNNPIDELTPQEIDEHDYFSDPHLIYKDGVLELYYRFTILKDKQPVGNKTILYKRTSADGVHWSDREQIVDLREPKDVAVWGEQIISQAVVWTGTEYLCWYVDASMYVPERHIRVAISKDGKTWEAKGVCELKGYEAVPWHIDVQYFDGLYRMVIYSDKQHSIAYLESEDGVHYSYRQTILSLPNRALKMYSELYRSCLVKGPENKVPLFYSIASGRINKSYIGRLDTEDYVHWTPVWKWEWQWLKDWCMVMWLKVKKKIVRK